MIQFYAKNTSGDWVLLDTNTEDIPKVSFAISSIEDPTVNTSEYSNEFTMPSTSTNFSFFQDAFDVNGEDFDMSKKAEAYITVYGVFFKSGTVKLNSVQTNVLTGLNLYFVQFFGSVSDFSTTVGNKTLNELDLSQQNMELNYANVINTWTTDTVVKFPLVEWGYTYTSGTTSQPEQASVSYGYSKSFTNPSNPYKPIQFRPAVQVKYLIDKIFSSAGFTYESTFLNSDMFKNLFMLSSNDASPVANVNTDINATGYNQSIGESSSYKLQTRFNTVTGASSLWNTTDHYYTVQYTGSGSITFSGSFDISQAISKGIGTGFTTAPVYVYVTVYDWETGAALLSHSTAFVMNYLYDCGTNRIFEASKTFSKTWTGFTFIEGKKLAVRTWLEGAYGGIWGGEAGMWYCPSSEPKQDPHFNNPKLVIDTPNILSITASMPTNVKQIDFLKSITDKFKLVFVPHEDKEKAFRIEPWKDWIVDGQKRDWSKKLDISKELTIKPYFASQQKEIVFVDTEDSDYPNANYITRWKQTFGRNKQDSEIDVITGQREVTTFFAPTPLDYVAGTTDWLVPHLAKETGSDVDNNRKIEPIQPKPRLLFWNGLQASSKDWFMLSTSTVPKTTYPLMSSFSQWPVTNSTFTLDWYSSTPYYSGSTPNTQTPQNAFEVYWRAWYDMAYSTKSRIMTCTMVLTYEDILNFRYNDIVFVNNSWWIVSKISDYTLGKTTPCKVELIKIPEKIGISIFN